ncbi:MAG: sigma-54-dependent Fis family transcriptional regulator [Archangium gephyra]|uniref:Sigma-54-dependent Fis family transcriptional regulator n=1 Tax=Archangium gephyra TaxID=48 RepID=A0A2W5TJ11_9BACT|nr:MAG: sigma-54-dependent Fis family transcriptional regulator [Archangium gephyra]
MSHQILIVEDDVAMAQLLVEGLQRRGYVARAVHSAEPALAALAEHDYQAVITDVNMKGLNGLELCQRIVAEHPGVPVLVITAFGSMDTAIRAIRAGAYDFLTKPFELEAIALAIGRAVQHKELREEVKRLRDEVVSRKGVSQVLGESAPMRELIALINRVADSESAVLVTGERGTGKELVARSLHEASRRRAGPFISLNCSALSAAALEGELFGYAKGSAPNDSKTARPGAFVRAQGGTLFLDDIAEFPLELQPRLLKALTDRKVRPVGSEQEVPFDARLVTATSRDLEAMAEEDRFRPELHFAINVVNVHIPPVRMRGNDVLLLAQHFVRFFAEKSRKEVTGIASSAAEKLLAYGWPGNVLELQNVIERAVALTRYAQLTTADLPEKVLNPTPATNAAEADEAVLVPMDTIERQHILRVLRAVGGHRTQAAKVLGLDRKTLYRKLEGYGPAEVEAALRDAPPRTDA